MAETKIEFVGARSSADIIGIMHPLVQKWFFSKFKDFSLTQLYGVGVINDRKNILRVKTVYFVINMGFTDSLISESSANTVRGDTTYQL